MIYEKGIIEKMMKKPPLFIFGRGDVRKIVPPVKLDQSKHNPEEDMIAFSLYPYMNIARELLESIRGSRDDEFWIL